MHKKTVFLTGATGLSGSYLLKILLEEGHKVYALARSDEGKSAFKRVTNAIKFWNVQVPIEKLEVIEGVVTENNFELPLKKIISLRKEIDEIFHCAADIGFNIPLLAIRKINVGGTKNILDFALECCKFKRLKKINHMSTAYVCGNYNGIFRESDLDVGQGFATTYEKTKFEAEKLVLKYRQKGLWIDIFRPALIVGESQFGKTFKTRQAFYQLIHLWQQELFDYFPGRDFYVNLVCIDELCNNMYCISSRSAKRNKTYHMFSEKQIPLKTILAVASETLHFRIPELVSKDEFFRRGSTPAQKMLLANSVFLLKNNLRFNCSQTMSALQKYGSRFKQFNKKILVTIINFLRT